MNPYTHQYYVDLSDGSRRSAAVVLSLAQQTQSFSSVVDFGCGSGEWLSVLPAMGVNDYCGVDGDWSPCVNHPCFKVGDLREPINLGRTFDLAISVEVAEHLPDSCADTFVETLCRHSDRILFSAAIPFQVGTDHINLQWPGYWSQKFRRHGFSCSDAFRIALWDRSDVMWWYRQNLLYVTKGTSGPEPMRIVHPELLEVVFRSR